MPLLEFSLHLRLLRPPNKLSETNPAGGGCGERGRNRQGVRTGASRAMPGFVVPERRAEALAGKFARRSLELVVSCREFANVPLFLHLSRPFLLSFFTSSSFFSSFFLPFFFGGGGGSGD